MNWNDPDLFGFNVEMQQAAKCLTWRWSGACAAHFFVSSTRLRELGGGSPPFYSAFERYAQGALDALAACPGDDPQLRSYVLSMLQAG